MRKKIIIEMMIIYIYKTSDAQHNCSAPANDVQVVPKKSLPTLVNFPDFKAFSHDMI